MAGAERTDARGARRRGHSPDAGRPAQRHAIRTTHARHRNSRRANRPNVRDLRQAIWPRRAALVLRFLAISTAPNSGRTTATLLRIACERRGARSEDARKKTSRGDLEIPPIIVIRRQKQAVNKRVDSLPDSEYAIKTSSRVMADGSPKALCIDSSEHWIANPVCRETGGED